MSGCRTTYVWAVAESDDGVTAGGFVRNRLKKKSAATRRVGSVEGAEADGCEGVIGCG